jgi:hypothetical protein
MPDMNQMHPGQPMAGVPSAVKRKKDPDAPKRPMSAFLDYSKTFRSQVILNNPDVKDNKEISKILGAMWRNASDAEKKPFVEKELRERAIFNEEMRQWKRTRAEHPPLQQGGIEVVWKNPNVPKTAPGAAVMRYHHENVEGNLFAEPLKVPPLPKAKRVKKDPEAPKRPMSAFLDYSKTYRAQVISNNPHVKDNKEISKILGILWRNASEAEKKPFVEKELIAREEYNERMRQWKKEKEEQIAEEAMNIGSDHLMHYASGHPPPLDDGAVSASNQYANYYQHHSQFGDSYMT